MEIKKYGTSSWWALYDHAGNLVCVTVYKKGAQEVAKLLAAALGRRKTLRRNPAKRQDYWVVTVRGGGGRKGYFSHGAHDFDTDIREAVRFALKSNAQRIARSLQDRPDLRDWTFSVAPVLTLVPGGKRNPVPPSSKARLKAAAKLYEDFTGHSPEFIDRVSVPEVDTAFVIGDADGVLYSCVRDGKRERYIHEWKKNARPLLCASYDGQNLMFLGGGYQFTERGIVDD